MILPSLQSLSEMYSHGRDHRMADSFAAFLMARGVCLAEVRLENENFIDERVQEPISHITTSE